MAEAQRQPTRVAGVNLGDAGGAAVQLAPAPLRALINLRGRPDDQGFATAVEDAIGFGLPEAPNRWRGGDDDYAIVWLGPDEWLVLAPDGQAADIESRLRAERADDPWMSIVDVSHNYTGFVLTGTKGREVLAKGCPLDLHPRAFTRGDCAQTLVVKSRALLRCLDEDSVEIQVRNSFAGYIAAWLIDAMEEFSN